MHQTSPKTTPPDSDPTTDEILEHVQFGGWTAMVLIPILYWINGPAVSNDQWYVRIGLMIIVYIGTPILAKVQWRNSNPSS